MFINIDTEKGITFSEKLGFEDALRLLGTAAISLMTGLDDHVKETDPDNYERVHGHIYDTFNIMCGNILDKFDSTRTPATDLTAEAILRAENEILDEAVPTEIEPDANPVELEAAPTEFDEEETDKDSLA